MLFCGKIQIRISESKSGFCVFGGTNPKADHESIKSTFSSDSSDQIQIRIFEIHNLSVFFLGKDLKKVFLTERFFDKKKKKTKKKKVFWKEGFLEKKKKQSYATDTVHV